MENFIKIECCNCGVLFAVSKQLNTHWEEDKKRFFCPNGHGQAYTKSTADELRDVIKDKSTIIFNKNREIAEQDKEIKHLKRKPRKAKKKK